MWSAASQIKFERVTDSNKDADILIKFVTGYHGDGRPADGPGKELAHAFFPLDNKGVFRQVKSNYTGFYCPRNLVSPSSCGFAGNTLFVPYCRTFLCTLVTL